MLGRSILRFCPDNCIPTVSVVVVLYLPQPTVPSQQPAAEHGSTWGTNRSSLCGAASREGQHCHREGWQGQRCRLGKGGLGHQVECCNVITTTAVSVVQSAACYLITSDRVRVSIPMLLCMRARWRSCDEGEAS